MQNLYCFAAPPLSIAARVAELYQGLFPSGTTHYHWE